ncbi:Signal transduction histidine kinase [Actinopolyspora xinjiangensis]|uniref:histidine kinase n=1 Tax=Actinopolyspora xinjiangensis TaxID=405564 RepID=A0A1H0WC99_9ACTN|nr:nitrate- and nitrite sensing domain-containing protein [Actinopolyspora xinjiangensis]SDP88228.1 Signal transduction histidine kinase [Actinopolyspora xinjiangensis]
MSAAARRANREQVQDTRAARNRPGGARRASLRDWRNWRIPVKLGAVVLVPVVFVLALGAFQIQHEVSQANRYEEISRLTEARDSIQPLLTGLQSERTKAAELLGGAPGARQAYREQYQKVTGSVEQAPRVLDNVQRFSPVTSAQFGELREQLGKLRGLRQGVMTDSLAPVEAIGTYNEIISSLLSMERAVINTIDDSRLYSTISALHELSRAEDEIRIQRALVDAALPRSDFTPALTDALNDSRARLDSRITSFESVANSEPRQARQVVNSEAMRQWLDVEDQLMRAIRVEDVHSSLTLDEWNRLSDQLISRTTEVRSGLSKQFNERAYSLYDEASDRAGITTVILVAGLIVAAAVIIVMGRNLLKSLDQLRRGALHAANEQLPRAVHRIRHGSSESEVEVDAVPVDTTEEVGQVARAFDEVNRQALYLASEQASLRRGYSDSFVNVSRRSQSLLERQLRLFEQLEHDEDDPDQLATLFRLDHLATRMRRNNENLMVLSGSDMARRFTQPVQLSDVLRAAISEIEHYPRVVVQSPPSARLVGYAGSDLVRLMAELLDNAANFSSPETSVTVSSHQSEDSSLTIDVLDEGIGMGEQELAEANERLASFDEYDLSTSRRMGLLVIARLAGRHGITVRLHGGDDVDGIRATVRIPPDLVVPEGPAQSTAQRTPEPSPSTIEQRLSTTKQDDSEAFGPEQPRNGTEQPPSSRVNGSNRRQVLEGGLPRFDLGDPPSLPTQQRGGSRPAGTQPPSEGDERSRVPESGTTQLPPPAPTPPAAPISWPESPDQAEPHDQPEPSVQPDSPAEPEPARTAGPATDPEPEGRFRGLFEPPDGQEYVETTEDDEVIGGSMYFDGFASEGGPQQRYSDSAPTVVHAIAPGHESAASASASPQWFHPSPEDAYHQSASRQNGVTGEWSWPGEDGTNGRGDSPAAPPRPDSAEQTAQHSRVEEHGPASQAGPSGFTASGLPRRTPRGQSKGANHSDPRQGSGSTNSSGTRGGLSWMEEAELRKSSDDPAADPNGGGIPEEEQRSGQSATAARRTGAPGVEPKYQLDGRARQQRDSSGWSTRSESPVNESSAWNFATDQAQQEADSAAEPRPSEYTSAGLPRRVPKQHLAPGSVPPPSGGTGAGAQNTPAPDETRGRLSSFQQGVRRGRHSAGE